MATPTTNKRAAKVVKTILSPVDAFLALETSSGILLMIAATIAMVWANSPWFESYEHFIELPIGFSFAGYGIQKSLHHWVNDGLMVIFFFVVGLEIKRELIIGELSSPKKAALPMFAALGGMVAPALIYASLNYSGAGASGWGIPMATDIAFAVGILTLMSRKVPFALKVFLLALAIVDDLGAVVVIALFYTDHVVRDALGIAAISLFMTYFLQLAGIRRFLPYLILGLIVWVAILKSGVHATIAGVLLGFITPIKPFYTRKHLPEKFRGLVDQLAEDLHNEPEEAIKLSHSNEQRLEELHNYVIGAQSSLERFIHFLHPWVSYFIMPLFALVNAGVHIENVSMDSFLSHPVSLGIILGLVVGKPIGVVAFSWLAVKFNIATLPRGVTWYNMLAVGFLAGIGFTMAIFISNLALENGDLQMFSKLGILAASLIAGVAGSVMLAFSKDRPKGTA